ncbi:MAG TPA: secondary thiamine-phosphate synthase enzyme YjbQ [Wenzhouxiangellaceae bacterium]|nr:secondary thiamine-phosphate synthase enzyme YjbQ [Wenzhouxiangellaceae bacterium]
MHRETLEVATRGRGFTEITGQVDKVVARSGLREGLCNVFILHTSASLVITENADPDVLADLETVISDLAPDGDSRYSHTAEGPDDMSAHVRCVLTQTSITIPVDAGALCLGTWQGLFLWEHRARPHARKIVVSLVSG